MNCWLSRSESAWAISYAPVITAVTQELLREWDVFRDSSEIDVGAAMMRTTLHIISRAMFSANSDEIVRSGRAGCWPISDGGAA